MAVGGRNPQMSTRLMDELRVMSVNRYQLDEWTCEMISNEFIVMEAKPMIHNFAIEGGNSKKPPDLLKTMILRGMIYRYRACVLDIWMKRFM